MVAPERRAIGAGIEIVAERGMELFQHREIARRLAIEAVQILEHRPEARTEQISLRGEQAGQRGSGIFQFAVRQRHGKGHVGKLRRNAKMGEQSGEIRVGQFVIDDEAGIDGDVAFRAGDRNGIRVSADAAIAFIDGDVVMLTEQPGR